MTGSAPRALDVEPEGVEDDIEDRVGGPGGGIPNAIGPRQTAADFRVTSAKMASKMVPKMVPQWELVLGLLWDCSGPALGRPWGSSGAALGLILRPALGDDGRRSPALDVEPEGSKDDIEDRVGGPGGGIPNGIPPG